MGATVQVQCSTGSGPTNANAETGIHFSREDTVNGSATPIPIPTAVGTKFSALKYLALNVTGTASTTISNRRIAWSSGPATGLVGWFFPQGVYTQNSLTQGTAAGNYPADNSATNGGDPGLAPTATVNGTQSSGQSFITVNSGGASFTNGMLIVASLGTTNQEILTVNGSATATNIPVTPNTTKTHTNGDTVAQAYTSITTSNQVYDSSSVSAGSTGFNGKYTQNVLGVDNSYAGGAGANTALPNLLYTYDEQ